MSTILGAYTGDTTRSPGTTTIANAAVIGRTVESVGQGGKGEPGRPES